MLPLIAILPLRLPISAEDATSMGTSFATGFPCLVMTIPSGPTRSRRERHCALNFAAGTVFTSVIVRQVRISVHYMSRPAGWAAAIEWAPSTPRRNVEE